MAFINQYEADQDAFARRQSTLGKIGSGIEKGLLLSEENRRRALDERNAATARNFEYAKSGATPDEIKEINETGMSQSLSDKLAAKAEAARVKAQKDAELETEKNKNQAVKTKYDADQLGLPLNQRDDYIKSMDSAQIRENIMSRRMGVAEDNKIKGEQRKLENQKKADIQKVNISGFDIAGSDVIPSTKDAEEVKKFNAANKTFQDVGNRAVQKVQSLDWRDKTGFTSKYKDLQQDVTEMRLQAKELANLGVLNGPDLTLVDQTLGSIGVTDLALYGEEEAAKRLKNAISTANQKLQNAANARGYAPKNNQPQDEDAAAIKWAEQNRGNPDAEQILKLHGVK